MFALHFHTSDIFKSVCMIAQNGAAFPNLVGCVCGGVMVEVVGERGGSGGGFDKNGLCLYPWDSNVKGHTNSKLALNRPVSVLMPVRMW